MAELKMEVRSTSYTITTVTGRNLVTVSETPDRRTITLAIGYGTDLTAVDLRKDQWDALMGTVYLLKVEAAEPRVAIKGVTEVSGVPPRERAIALDGAKVETDDVPF